MPQPELPKTPTLFITVFKLPKPYTPAQVLVALRAVGTQFVTIRAAGVSPELALDRIEADLVAASDAGGPIAGLIHDYHLKTKVESSVATDGEAFIALGEEPWNWAMHTHLDYLGVVNDLPELPYHWTE